MATDTDRRDQLRSFLTYARSRLSPADVGLPAATRRRVPGLRRQEVAELISVSDDWYRWFESGRPITVSPHMLARLGEALRLNAFDQTTLYRLALPALYQAEAISTAEPASSMPSLVTQIRLPSDIEEARRVYSSAREAFLTHSADDECNNVEGVTSLRSRILKSWKRSQALHVDENLLQASRVWGDSNIADARAANEPLMRAAAEIIAHLADVLADTGYAVLLTDPQGRILQLEGQVDVRRRLARVGLQAGGDLSEAGFGTNAIGTTLLDGRPLQLMSSEHFCEGVQDLTCTAAPIHDPKTGTVAGVLDFSADYRLVRSQILASAVQYALEIEERLASPDL